MLWPPRRSSARGCTAQSTDTRELSKIPPASTAYLRMFPFSGTLRGRHCLRHHSQVSRYRPQRSIACKIDRAELPLLQVFFILYTRCGRCGRYFCEFLCLRSSLRP